MQPSKAIELEEDVILLRPLQEWVAERPLRRFVSFYVGDGTTHALAVEAGYQGQLCILHRGKGNGFYPALFQLATKVGDPDPLYEPFALTATEVSERNT